MTQVIATLELGSSRIQADTFRKTKIGGSGDIFRIGKNSGIICLLGLASIIGYKIGQASLVVTFIDLIF